ncbi:protein kinase domain-containing protein [Phosphitispora sp. TUW77]|uniref:protein kinase domain-containing protein n=1 Tax=Phosphitispora sp. TUW77 TaxID=3152361 RepID=UPI003AB72E4D
MSSGKLKPFLKPGQIIRGRWERNSYEAVRFLGGGGSGIVYLVRDRKARFRAMKISTDMAGISYEHRILVQLNNNCYLSESDIIPGVYELDDFQLGSVVYHFFITEYFEGKSLGRLVGRIDCRNALAIGVQIRRFLSSIHEVGLIFGDLKPGNIILDQKHDKIHIVDYGSVSIKGHCLKQYTPCYDRASWHAGSRIADEGYDLFSLGMLLLSLVLGKQSQTGNYGLDKVISTTVKKIGDKTLRNVIINSLKQQAAPCFEQAEDSELIPADRPRAEADPEVGAFVNYIGAVSIISFMLSLAYYYQ